MAVELRKILYITLKMLLFLLSLLPIGLYLLWREYQSRIRRFKEYADKVPGPPSLPILGNALDFGLTNKSFFNFVNGLPKKYGGVSCGWVGPILAFVLVDPVSIEFVLNSSKGLRKSSLYKFSEPVLGQGLLTSDGEIWRRHRKIVAPTFKGHVLEQFMDIFNLNTDALIGQLLKYQNGPDFDIAPLMNLYTLDIICESAMGVKVNAMVQSDSDYVKAINGAEELIYTRIFKPWLHSDLIFSLTSMGRRWVKYVHIIHDMVRGVVQERKKMRAAEQVANVNVQKQEEETGYGKKTAFLDHLLQYMEKGADLTDQELLDEVHNIMAADFMLQGHDTTAVGLSFICWLLAKHPHIQEKAVAELRTIFGDSMRHANLQDLNEMKYLEQIIKESLRILPPVPLIARQPPEDVVTDKYTFPEGCEIAINIFMLHRHPDHFPDPERFDPDRFLPENCVGRHPYCYLPFGGGPRICLGYKYALYEMKVAMAHILRHFKILPADNPFQDLDLTVKIVLKSQNGVCIKLEPRNFANEH